MNRPFIIVVLFYAMGLLLGKCFQPPLTALFSITFCLLGFALAFEKVRPYLLCALLAFTGWTNLVFHTAILSPCDLRLLLGSQPAIVNVRGRLIETPHIKLVERHDIETEHSLAQVEVTAWQHDGQWQPASGKIIVATPNALASDYFAGQNVEISGVIACPPSLQAEGLFDYREYLRLHDVYYELKTQSTNDWKLSGATRSRPPLTDRFLAWSKQVLARGLPAEDEPLRLLWAMTLGWRTAFSNDISEPFLRAGTMHMFAIDGLRIALIAGILVALLRTLQVSRAWCGVIAIPLIWFYTAATGWESPAVRASVMMSVVIGGWALKRPSDLLNSLAVAASIILAWEPRQLFEASFQLSFFVMLIIAVMLPPLNDFLDRILQHDPLLPEVLISDRRKFFLRQTRYFARFCALSFTAWIGSLPLSIKYFHLFSLISTPANLLAVPLGTLALMANLGAIICGNWFTLATELFNHAAWFFMTAMTWVSVESSRIPGAYFYVPEISWFTVGFFYLAVVAFFCGWLKTSRHKIISGVILLFVATIYFVQWENTRAEVDLTVLPLNGGHAIYVDATGQANDWLVDCGDETSVDFTLKNYLHAQGVNRIPRLVLTEGDKRNIGGASLLDKLFGVGELWTSNVKFRSPTYRETVTAFETNRQPSGSKPSRHKIFDAGKTIDDWQMLYPIAGKNLSHADDNALVLQGNFPGCKVLLLSDLSRAGQSALLAATTDLHADIVVTGLPNEGEPLCDALLAAIQPKLIIIADSELPANRRAKRELKDRLAEKNVPVIYTSSVGAVKIVINKNDWKLQSPDGQALGYSKR
jgi:competence protein ComEC